MKTLIDIKKNEADFLIQYIDDGMYTIKFKEHTQLKGNGIKKYDDQRYLINKKMLKKLQSKYSFMTDF